MSIQDARSQAASANMSSPLAFGLSFADLATRDGLVRLDRLFLDALATEDADLHASLLAARAAPDSLDAKAEGELVVALGRHLDPFVADAVRHRGGGRRDRRPHPRARSHPRLQAPVRAAPGGEEIRRSVRLRRPRPARGAGTPASAAADRAAFRRTGDGLGRQPRTRPTSTTRCATPPGPRSPRPAAPRIAAARCSASPHRIDPAHLVPVETIERDGVTMLRLPEHDWRQRDGFALTDPGMNDPAGAGPDQLLHLVPHPGQGLLLQGPDGSQDRRVSEIAVRRDARRLPAGREDQRNAHAARRRARCWAPSPPSPSTTR